MSFDEFQTPARARVTNTCTAIAINHAGSLSGGTRERIHDSRTYILYNTVLFHNFFRRSRAQRFSEQKKKVIAYPFIFPPGPGTTAAAPPSDNGYIPDIRINDLIDINRRHNFPVMTIKRV